MKKISHNMVKTLSAIKVQSHVQFNCQMFDEHREDFYQFAAFAWVVTGRIVPE